MSKKTLGTFSKKRPQGRFRYAFLEVSDLKQVRKHLMLSQDLARTFVFKRLTRCTDHVRIADWPNVELITYFQPRTSRAARAATCSASCFDFPSPSATSSFPRNTPTVNFLSWSGPVSLIVLYAGVMLSNS